MGYRNYGPANGFIVSKDGNGDFTTIASALTAATSGTTIFIKPGTYTENLTLKAGVNLTAFGSDGSDNGTGVVIINGNCTLSVAGSLTISGIQLQTNSANLITVSGSVASILNLDNCYLNCTNNTGINYSSSSASSAIYLYQCVLNLTTTGIGYHSSSGAGLINYNYCNLINSGASTTASNNSAGIVVLSFCVMSGALSASATGVLSLSFSIFNIGIFVSATPISTTGTGASSLINSQVTSGSAPAISIGSGSSITIDLVYIQSMSTNAITGAGTCTFSGIVYNQLTNFLNNITNQAGGTIQGIRAGNAPSAGYIGEQIRGQAITVSLSNGTPKTITSINLTPGVWDICGNSTSSGSAGVITANIVGISTTTNSVAGLVEGDNLSTTSLTATVFENCNNAISGYRVTLSASATYFLVQEVLFATGTVTGNGRISATRVG